MSDGQLKATITRNQYGNFQVVVALHRGSYVPSPKACAVTYTLKGARKKASKLIAKVEREMEMEKFIEVVT
ncbi:hypothetical protein [Arthrobacter sp. ISL-69]|uniref:hypothetical protein n=1 Tax=Arthrobacter sp. ISL-69 TaxID=2819113 RepID=UPI001BE52A25|nr:hypothetical protein [Arthrobacter sp. ISL-69]MBT2537213.1 hypothetical protein [Arthrobacter sp. ISL-69]